MGATEYRCYGCSSTFVIRNTEVSQINPGIRCPRCASTEVERYHFPHDACRLYNLAEANLSHISRNYQKDGT